MVFGYVWLLLGLLLKPGSGDHGVTYDGDSEVAEGESFEIHCKMSLRDPSEWTLDSRPIDAGGDSGYVTTEREFDTFHKELALRVEVAQLHHQGEYRCDGYSRDFHHVRVIAGGDEEEEEDSPREDQSSRAPSNDVTLEVNETVVFFCSSAEDESTAVTWYKDSRRIVENPDSNVEIEGRYLSIREAQETDAGQYMCTVDKPRIKGYTDIGRIFHLNSPAKIVDFPSKINIIRGRSLTLHCRTQGYPPPRITWFIGNRLASERQRGDQRVLIYSSDGGQQQDVLTVREVGRPDQGRYACRAENSVDQGATVQRDEESVFVYIRENMIETNEEHPGAGKMLVLEKELVLQCNTSECPQCRVVWYKDNIPLYPLADRLLIYEENNSVVINRANYSDSGIYTCAIDRKQLDVALNASIVVQSEIKLVKFDSVSAVVFEGSPLELNCVAKGAPPPSIKWFRGEKEIDDVQQRIKILDHDGLKNAKLLIEEADFDDRNHYTCEAYNQLNSVNTTIFIRIKGRLAALWPFLGICLEVVILCTIIFVYERRKSLAQTDDPDTTQPKENKNTPERKSKGQDVRQRK